jgi:hypothetical protein
MDKISSTDFLNMHAFNHAPAAMRIFRFAADSLPRVLELAHVTPFLRECATEFGSADTTLPDVLRREYVAGRYFKLRSHVEHNMVQCPWLAAKILACRNASPMPAVALMPDVTRHDVNWRAEGVHHHESIVSEDGTQLTLTEDFSTPVWAQAAVGVTSGKHWFSVTATKIGWITIGWTERGLRTDCLHYGPELMWYETKNGRISPSNRMFIDGILDSPCEIWRQENPLFTIGCLLDLDAGIMTVFADDMLFDNQPCYEFRADREWFPTVGMKYGKNTVISNSF